MDFLLQGVGSSTSGADGGAEDDCNDDDTSWKLDFELIVWPLVSPLSTGLIPLNGISVA